MGPDEQAAVAEVLASGQLAQGARVAEFEAAFARYVGCEEAVAVSSGTEALRLALLAIGVGPGDEVVVPALTFVATASAVTMCGGVPVVADVDPATFCLDPASAEAAMTDRTRAVVPVHLYGHPADLDPLMTVCRGRGVAVVEDAAQAHGARY
jgi:dTDP-4-amino-4,6-dideoxygalactose transaminase